MKKVLVLMILCFLLMAGTAVALPYNVRPLEDPPARLLPPHNELTLGGVGGIFDSIGADTYAADPIGTQSSAAIFTNTSSGGSIASFIIAVAGNSGSNQIGLYEFGDTSNRVPIFGGTDSAPALATVIFLADGTVTVLGAGEGIVAGSYPGFGNVFGFYLQGPGGLFYSEDDKNAGNPQALIYQGNGIDFVTIPGLNGGTFTENEWIIAFEDLPYGASGTDRDFNDFVFMVESIKPVPEPATMLLLGVGLIGLAGIGRRKLFKK